MKKRILIIIAGVTAIVLAIMLGTGFLAIQLLSQILRDPVIADLPKYDHSDCYYSEGFRDYTDYCKYFFSDDSNVIQILKDSPYFKPVAHSDVEELKNYFDDFEGWVEFEDYKDHYDFAAECIDTLDYFYIEDKAYKKPAYYDKYESYNVYFFDTQTKTLFFIHSNT